MEKVKTVFVGVFTALSAWLGILAIPVYLLVLANIIDYGTGLTAAKYRGQTVNSYVGFRGIAKKVCMWLLICLGAMVDILITYGAEQAGITLNFGYAVGCLVAVWLICNEIISILENMVDIGVDLPPFLARVVENLKTQVEKQGAAALPEETGKKE
ncbi:holin family protein [Faecalispora jeddahensis]|uniref:phage holin family protein n=1 Tax=Faecalispora jeddahensis TaxID=1414721 RepID=UPI00189753B3|nr:phage holin family protein [Faecalispora jeddahensis]